MTGTAGETTEVEQTLDRVELLFAARRAADAEMFVLATRFADLHPPQTVRRRRDGRVLPGMERAMRLGGEGTPAVAEFACVELGARMQLGSWSAQHYLADALDVRHRLPLTWRRVELHEARIPLVRLMASRTRHLSVEAAAAVDEEMCEHVDGSLPWSRFEARLDGRIVAADPAAAAAREAARAAAQFARRTLGSEDGTAGFFVRSSIGVIARLDATVAFVAEALAAFGDTEPLDVRRVKAVLVLANPTQAVELLAAYAAQRARSVDTELPLDEPEEAPADAAPDAPADETSTALDRMDAFARRVGFTPTRLPRWLAPPEVTTGDPSATFSWDWSRLLPPITLDVHIAGEHVHRDADGVARWEGEGPITTAFIRDRLAPLHRFVVQPVIDLPGMRPVDAYELPDRHRRAVRLRTPAAASPFSSCLTPVVDADHTVPYDPALAQGPERQWSSRLDNLAPLGRFDHRLKTHGRWTVKQPFSGILLWRDPHGQVYLVDHTGSRKVTPPGGPVGAAPARDVEADVWPGATVVEVDFRA